MAIVRRWLESRHVYTQNEWLQACINFVKEDNEERQLTSVQLNELVYEQWLMAEIQESSLPRLPEGLGSTDICKLDGHFNLQINSVLNVGESAYSQIQKMKGQDDPEELNWKTNPSEPKIKATRMLLLELTDGTQTVFGMEYQLIPVLKVTTPPGTKIQVSGHITCRLGAMLLTASNVRVLGGSVQSLEENTFWNVLHQAIGQDPPQQPGVIKTEAFSDEETNVNQISIQSGTARDVIICDNQQPLIKTEAQPRNTLSAGLASNNQRDNKGKFSEFGGRLTQQGQKGTSLTVKGVVPANSSHNIKMEKVSDQEFFDDDDDIIAAIAEEDYFGIEEDFDMEQIDQLESGMQNTNTTVTTKRITNSSSEIVENEDLEICDGDEMFDDDFISEDLPLEVDEQCIEIKPLHRRIGNKGNMGILHQSKKAKISDSSSVEFSNGSRSIHRPASDINSTKSKDVCTAKTGPIVNKSNFPFGSSSVKTEPHTKPSTSGTLKLSSTKRKGLTKPNSHLATTSFPQSFSLQMQNDVSKNNHFTTTVAYGNHPRHNLDHCLRESNPFEAQDLVCNPAPFQYLSHVLKSCPVSEECIVRVKAYIATIVSRSQPMSPNWNVTVKLNDGTGTVDADLSDKVLTELLEFPVDEFRREMLEAIKTRHTALCQRLHKRTELFQRNLASTSCLMDLQFSPDMPHPHILHLAQPTSMDVSEMVRHVSALL